NSLQPRSTLFPYTTLFRSREYYLKQVHAASSKVDVIYNAVDFAQAEPTVSPAEVRASLGIAADAPTAGVIARLTEQKGHRFLFRSEEHTSELQSRENLVCR